MKTHSLLAILVSLFFVSTSFAQNITAQQVINNYLDAIGGVKRLKKVKNISTVYSISDKGSQISGELYQQRPNKYAMIMQKDSSLLLELRYDGENGVSKGAFGEIELEKGDLDELKIKASLFPELDYEKLGVKTELAGQAEVEGQTCYEMEIFFPGGKKLVNYYDTKSFLKVRTTEFRKETWDEIFVVTDFGNYQKIKKIQFPFVRKVTSNEQTMIMNVKSIDLKTKIPGAVFNPN